MSDRESGPGPASGASCPGEGALRSYASGALPPEERDAVAAHLSSCPPCRGRVEAAVASNPETLAPHGLPGGAAADPDATYTSPPPRPAAAPAPGQAELPRAFGPYAIVRRLGMGGMGVVYEAVHGTRRRPEALKVLRGGLGQMPDLVERFHREVQAMASLSHDHVVRVFDAGQIGEELYYTMPLLPGSSLGDLLKEVRTTGEPVPGTRACAVLDRFGIPRVEGTVAAPEEAYARRVAGALVGVADALALMHGRGLLHRDLKPANLMIDEKGRVLVADFGLVRWGDQRITKSGQALGTPAYMSPEQVLSDGSEPDGRMDIYALGATLYELLALRLPHEGGTGLDTIRMKLSRRVRPVREWNPAVPVDIETLVGRCLERRREDRYTTAAALRDDLAAFARGEPVKAKPVSAAARAVQYLRRHALPIGVSAAVLLGAAAWWYSRPTLLTVTTLPPGQLLLDGTEIGTTPVAAFRIEPGAHEVRVEHPRFLPFDRKFTASRGSSYEWERGLQARDPADPEALRLVAAAAGIPVSGVKVEIHRGTGEPAPFTVLFPRGKVRGAPGEARLWADAPSEGYRAVLEDAGAGGAREIAVLPVPPSVERVALAIPAAARALLVPGGTYRLRLLDAAGAETSAAEFTLLRPEEIERLDGDLAAVEGKFEPGDPTAAFLAVEVLLARGAWEEAYDRVVSLSERKDVGLRREVARAALAVLERAGLAGRGWWAAWSDVYLDEGR